MVTEGLADHFSVQVFPGPAPPWSNSLSEAEFAGLLPHLAREWASPMYDYYAWFFGYGSAPRFPRWTGYCLGYRIVEHYLNVNRTIRPHQLHDVHGSVIFKPWVEAYLGAVPPASPTGATAT